MENYLKNKGGNDFAHFHIRIHSNSIYHYDDDYYYDGYDGSYDCGGWTWKNWKT